MTAGRITEQTRQDYLDAMGIQSWFPRMILPNALPHREFDFTEGEGDTSESHELSAREAMQVLGLPESHSEPEVNVPAEPVRPTLVTQETAPEKTEQPRADRRKAPAPATSKFRLVALAPNDDCLVVAEMPHSGINQFTRFHMRLLTDILRAIQHTATPDMAMNEFVWPLGNAGLIGQMDQCDSSAADAVCAFLSNQFGLARRNRVLLFGPAAARFVIDPARSFEELRGIQPGLHAGQYFAASHGLNELMKLPALKAEAWKDIAPLLSMPSINLPEANG